jgi:quinoprotein glucose dehydrogenase
VSARAFARALRLALAVALFALAGSCTRATAPGAPIAPLDTDWADYLGDPARTHFSPLRQIHRGNVRELEVAWTYDAGGAEPLRELQCNPLIADGVLYGLSPRLVVFALDAASGRELWRYDPYPPGREGQVRSRGLAYWRDPANPRDARLYLTAGPELLALDAHTGHPVASFGSAGRVDLRAGLGRESRDSFLSATTPGAIYRDLLILGSRVSEETGAAPGHVRAFDLRTGAQRWIFHTIPQPGAPGSESWPARAFEEAGGANAWSGISVDEGRGMVFLGTGSATPDFYGAARLGDNLYANSLVALDAATGAYRWHYQLVRHDLWDRDLPAPPNLVTLARDGVRIDAVAQVTKSGHVFAFLRETGKPLFRIEEHPAPPSTIPGEGAAPSQPLPTAPPPFTRQRFAPEMITRRTPEATRAVRERLAALRTAPFEAPSLEGSLLYPGTDGGAEWGGAAFDPASGLLFVNANEIGAVLRLVELTGEADGRALYLEKCGGCHGGDLTGTNNGPSLAGVVERLDPQQLYVRVLLGRGRMPGFPGLGMPEMMALFGHLANPAGAAVSESATASRAGAPSRPHTRSPARPRFVNAGYQSFTDPDGYPANTPPWGTLTAIDLARGSIAWQRPLGSYAELRAQGLTDTGAENYGGAVVTAGGLLFIAATPDERIRAFDSASGELLWEAELPFSGFATPATYAIGGRQYLVIAAGGGKLRRPSGASYVAFALPDAERRER